MYVKYFIRPNGAIYEIIELEVDKFSSSLKITLENKMSRWFKFDEIVINPPVIKMK
jgi:hypothetical protein